LSICLTTLFEGDGSNYHCELIESNIIDGIWPGNHDITLLTRFVDCHFDGDWNGYLYFGQWAEEQRLAVPSVSIQLDDWLSLKLDGADPCQLSSSLGIECIAASAEDTARSPLVHKLCNKTAHNSVDSLTSITGRRSGTSSAKTLLVQPDIHTMFPAMRACTPDKIAAAKFMDKEWVNAEETRVARMQAQKETFANATKLTVAKEKRVHWSPHEPAVAMPQPNNSMAPADTLDKAWWHHPKGSETWQQQQESRRYGEAHFSTEQAGKSGRFSNCPRHLLATRRG
jgi:hypothetical protein